MTETAVRALLASELRPADLAGRQARLNALSAHCDMPGDVVVEPVDADGAKAEWMSTPGADPKHAILFLHGGGYVAELIRSRRHMLAQAERDAGTGTLALEHPYTAALDDAPTGYRFLVARGLLPENIAVAGESADGGLAIAMLVLLRDAGTALPACAWLSSPQADLEMSGATMASEAEVEPLIQRPYLL